MYRVFNQIHVYLRKKPDRSLNISFFTNVDGPEHVDAGLDRAVAGGRGLWMDAEERGCEAAAPGAVAACCLSSRHPSTPGSRSRRLCARGVH